MEFPTRIEAPIFAQNRHHLELPMEVKDKVSHVSLTIDFIDDNDKKDIAQNGA